MKQKHREIEVLVERKSRVGEGAIWDDKRQVLHWVDILDGKVFEWDPSKRTNRSWDTCQAVGTVVPCQSEGLALALHNGFAKLDLSSGCLSPLGDPEADRPGNRFNDGKCDPAGRFWAGTMDYFGEKPERGALYCLHPDGRVEKKLSNVSISNGIAWSLDASTMYYVDTGRNNLRSFDYDLETGEIGNEQVLIDCQPPGHFDGITLDAEGMLWIAIFDGSAVRRYDPGSGRMLEEIALPVSQVTSVALGGQNLTDLFVTSASHGFDEDRWKREPLSGSLLKVPVDVPGVAACRFAG